ncbi:hypothetical protein QBC39DRAFT_357823 [Podospora conica]|nr:hypothetical protein QBC39DRAFT_357823 [Schizothecium conicum]
MLFSKPISRFRFYSINCCPEITSSWSQQHISAILATMDGPRPNEGLDQAPNLRKVFVCRDEDQFFIKDSSSTSILTVMRPMKNYDDKPGCKPVRTEEDWGPVFDEVTLPSSENNNVNPPPTTLLLFASPEPEQDETLLRTSTTGSLRTRQKDECPGSACGHNAQAESMLGKVFNSLGRLCNQIYSVLPLGSSTSIDDKFNAASVAVDSEKPAHDRKRLRKMPFTVKTFQYVMKRMSIHNWVTRVISRADVSTFEQTTTEMALYSSSCAAGKIERAIIYNCRTSNAWAADLALTVTYFPSRRLTFAVLFGCSREQEKMVISRLKKAGDDVAHPMLLPGIVAELERKRQFDVVEDMINEIETQIWQLTSETVATWNQHDTTKAERNKQKTQTWLDMSFSRNFLQAQMRLLMRMRKHVSKFPGLIKEQSETASSDSETVTVVEGERLLDSDSELRISNAGVRMRGRLLTLIDEYEEKILDCSMRLEGMAMATQWSQGETNMEIAAATGRDSSQMRSIAFVTMVFLPGTFIASFFSMTFFNWNSNNSGDPEPVLSGKIWIYFCLTGVFTLITLTLFWHFIVRRPSRKKKYQQQDSMV